MFREAANQYMKRQSYSHRRGAERQMTAYIGVDDTDSTQGMCTTYVLTEIVRELDFPVLLGHPKLVRLNPNIPWKTRGNGALALALGGSPADSFQIGEIDGRRVFASYTPATGCHDIGAILEKVSSVVGRLAELGDSNTNPGVAVSAERPDSGLYWRVVREIVELGEVQTALRDVYGRWRTWKNGRGLIGAAAAISWMPKDKTYEVITYRKREKWGTSRIIDVTSVSRLSADFPSTFSNYDVANRHTCIAPSSPCPVLFGIRGDDPSVLESAMRSVHGETVDRWLIFESNQGTDDHITEPAGKLELFHSYMLQGTVSSEAETIRGGHVFFSMRTTLGDVRCAAFEETKELRNAVRSLVRGDAIAVWGSIKQGVQGESFNIEKMAVISLAKKLVKTSNPRCPACSRPMQSAGKNSGYRCKECHTRSTEAEYSIANRQIVPGLYSTAVASRRHLSKPPERMDRSWQVEGMAVTASPRAPS